MTSYTKMCPDAHNFRAMVVPTPCRPPPHIAHMPYCCRYRKLLEHLTASYVHQYTPSVLGRMRGVLTSKAMMHHELAAR